MIDQFSFLQRYEERQYDPANNFSEYRSELRDVASRLIGVRAEIIFNTWENTDLATLDLLLQTAKDMKMREEMLALGLWRISEGSRRPDLDLDVEWLATIFAAAREAGLAHAGIIIAKMLRQRQQNKLNFDRSLLDVAALHIEAGLINDALNILKGAPNSVQRQQLLLEVYIAQNAPEVGSLLGMLLRELPTPTRKRLWQMRPAIGRSKALTGDVRLLHFIIETCNEDALPFILACAMDAGHIENIERSLLERLPNDKPFWSAVIGRAPESARYWVLAELSSIFVAAGLGSVNFDSQVSAASNALQHLSATTSMLYPSSEKVDIVVCAYNAQDTIEYALKSVCSQSHKNLSVIVVDDCSPEPLRMNPDWFMGREVRLHRNETNLGPYLSRNAGIDLSDANVVGFHDADDWMHPDKITHQLSELDGTIAVAHYGAVVRMRPDGLITPENNGCFLGDGPITGVFRREAFNRAGRFASVRTRGDIEFRRRLESVLGAEAVMSSSIPYVLAVDWDSNSKKMTKTLSDWQKIRSFVNHSADMRPLANFLRDRGSLHSLINSTMPISQRLV